MFAMGTAARFHHFPPPPSTPPLRRSPKTPHSVAFSHSADRHLLGFRPIHCSPPVLLSFPHRQNHKHLFCSSSTTTSSSFAFFGRSARSATGALPISSIFPFDLSCVTPLTICKWSAVIALALAAAKRTIALLLNPFFWTYFSFAWVFWPWLLAIALAVYAAYCFRRQSLGQSTVLEQVAIVTATITWLTVVPPAHFNGFLEGWPVAMFFIYHYFFFFESSVRHRLYGDLYPREHDSKWDVCLPWPFRIGFALLILTGHWLAAYEGPELHLISGGWANVATWLLVLVTLFMRYHSVLYLAKYSEKVVVPTAVVQFGPYRWVRHPIYASTMLLFALHCITLRAPLSLLFLMAVGLVYYGEKANVEEALMVETFGDRYTEYMSKVRYRLIPFVY